MILFFCLPFFLLLLLLLHLILSRFKDQEARRKKTPLSEPFPLIPLNTPNPTGKAHQNLLHLTMVPSSLGLLILAAAAASTTTLAQETVTTPPIYPSSPAAEESAPPSSTTTSSITPSILPTTDSLPHTSPPIPAPTGTPSPRPSATIILDPILSVNPIYPTVTTPYNATCTSQTRFSNGTTNRVRPAEASESVKSTGWTPPEGGMDPAQYGGGAVGVGVGVEGVAFVVGLVGFLL